MNPTKAHNLGVTADSCEVVTNSTPRPFADPWVVLVDGCVVTSGDLYYCTGWVADLRNLEGKLW